MSTRHRLLRGALLIAATLQPALALPAQLGPMRITLSDRGYAIVLDAVIGAPRDRVFAVLSDYTQLARINPEIKSSTSSRSPTGAVERVRMVLHSCVWLFCRNLVQIEDVREPNSNTIVAHIIPGEGDFRDGSSVWRLESDGEATRLHYEASRTLTRRLPRFVRASAVKRRLRTQYRASIEALERLARNSSQGREIAR